MTESVYKNFVAISPSENYATKRLYEKLLIEMQQTHKSSWEPNSKGGEPNCRR